MNSESKILIKTLKGTKQEKIPFWFMRQAGRYLPEYREVRAKHKNFLEFCYTPKAACEVTLQPIRRFGMDAAIIFSDILVVPHRLGMNVWFEEGHGPRMDALQDGAMLAKLSLDGFTKRLEPVYEALELTRAALPKETALIGFAGSPWTLACYMIEGKSSKEFEKVKAKAKEEKEFFAKLISLLEQAVLSHIDAQVKAGAEVIQLFDSWAGILPEDDYRQWVVEPTARIAKKFKALHPHVPLIGFARQSGAKFLAYGSECGLDAISVDRSVPLEWIRSKLQPRLVVQGCLNQELLASNKQAMLDDAKAVVDALGDKPFVFNLSHGILPATPVENMQALCDYLRQVKK